jgi:hypothetical protein
VNDLIEAARELVAFLRDHGYCPPGLETRLVAVEQAIERVTP